MKLQVVGIAKDFLHVAAFNFVDQISALSQARPENFVREICLRFRPSGDSISHRHGAASQPRDLRKNKPHPMAALATLAQLCTHPLKYGVLGLHKSLQVMRIAHQKFVVQALLLLPNCDSSYRSWTSTHYCVTTLYVAM